MRVAVLQASVPLSALPSRLRRVRPLPAVLGDPGRLLAAVDRLGPYLPPWRIGWCLKRSLLLLDLWARCGLAPRLHVATRRGDDGRLEGHAWISAHTLAVAPGEPALESAFVEAWSS
jgi:hypothetical protein